jgi:hypothetical protein
MKTFALIDIQPQIGLQNTQLDAGFFTPLLAGVLIGIVIDRWFL